MDSPLWFAIKATFILGCFLGGTLMLIWVAAVAISAAVESKQERACRRRNNYRVGSVVK